MVIRRLVEFFTASQCLGCEIDGQILCPSCLNLASKQRSWNTASSAPLSGLAVGGYYDEALKELIWRLKFHRLREAAVMAAELVVRALPAGLPATVVTAVPIAPARYRERGYNQAGLVGREVARHLALPYRSLLGRENAQHQVGLDRAARLEQVKGAFYAMRRVEGAHILVVDDVVTTGATLAECASVLRMAGAETVWGAAVARH